MLQSQHVCESGIEWKDAEKKNADHNGTEDTGTEVQFVLTTYVIQMLVGCPFLYLIIHKCETNLT